MSMRKMDEQNIRKIAKVGRGKTFAVTIPIDMMRRLGWKEKQKVTMRLKGQSIVIRDWKK